MEFFTKNLPKAELHAHLNGCLSKITLAQLVDLKRSRFPDYVTPNFDALFDHKLLKQKSLKQVFQLFPIVHDLIDCDGAVYKATCDAISDFAADNVKYLELRTCPKCNAASGMTAESYVASVVKAIQDSMGKLDVCVKLLLSIDRTKSMENACETLKIAQTYFNCHDPIVVGIDLSGDPHADGAHFLDVLRYAKSTGLKISLHLAEISGMEKEVQSLLSLPPDRIGHGTFLHTYSSSVQQRVHELNVPIELCLTSNVISGTVASYEEHHLKRWYNKNPVIICTDDSGIFGTTLSREYEIASKALQLSEDGLNKLVKCSFDYAFTDRSKTFESIHFG